MRLDSHFTWISVWPNRFVFFLKGMYTELQYSITSLPPLNISGFHLLVLSAGFTHFLSTLPYTSVVNDKV